MNTRTTLNPLLLVTFAAGLLIAGHFFIALPQCRYIPGNCADTSIVYAPYRYRMLGNLLEHYPALHYRLDELLYASIKIHAVAVLVTTYGMYAWLKRHASAERALMGVFIMAAAWLFGYHFYNRETSTALELMFFTLALVFIGGRLWPIAVITLLATLNRETGFFVVLIYAAWYFDKRQTRRYWLNVIVLSIVYAVPTLATHYALGPYEHTKGLLGTLQHNLNTIVNAVLINLALAPVWAAAFLSYRIVPPPFKRLLWVAALALSAIAVGGTWAESARLTIILYPLILPAIIYKTTSAPD